MKEETATQLGTLSALYFDWRQFAEAPESRRGPFGNLVSDSYDDRDKARSQADWFWVTYWVASRQKSPWPLTYISDYGWRPVSFEVRNRSNIAAVRLTIAAGRASRSTVSASYPSMKARSLAAAASTGSPLTSMAKAWAA